MPFNKETAQEAGRKSSRKGTPNKAGQDLRKVVADLVEANIQAIIQDLAKLEPKDRVTAWIRLLEFCVPKLTKGEVSGPDGAPMETIIQFVDDSGDNTYFLTPGQPAPPVANENKPELTLPPLPPVVKARPDKGPEEPSPNLAWK